MRVLQVVDLSMPLDAGTRVYPGDPVVEVAPAATIAEHGYNVLSLRMGSQSGTHCDAPYHFREGGARIDEMPLERFAGTGVVVEARHRGAREAVTVADLAPVLDRVGPGTPVLLRTGWDRHLGTPAWYDHPYLAGDACRLLVDRGVRLVGLDAPNLDETPDADHPGDGWPCHLALADAGGAILENLVGLDAVDFADPFVCALPLRLTGGDGAPVRAVAMRLG